MLYPSPARCKAKIKGCILCLGAFVIACVLGVLREARYQKLIGDAIRTCRKNAGLTQEKLAEKAELHPVYVGELERGEQTASVSALMKIAKALKVRVRDLVREL